MSAHDIVKKSLERFDVFATMDDVAADICRSLDDAGWLQSPSELGPWAVNEKYRGPSFSYALWREFMSADIDKIEHNPLITFTFGNQYPTIPFSPLSGDVSPYGAIRYDRI
jgi:hypothetical protein